MLAVSTKKNPLFLSRHDNGVIMTAKEFDSAEFEDAWRYELINGILQDYWIFDRFERTMTVSKKAEESASESSGNPLCRRDLSCR